MARAGRYQITIEQGTTFFVIFRWKDSNEAPIDLTGMTIRMQVREAHGGVVLADVDNGGLGGITTPTPTNGEIHVTIAAAVTAAMAKQVGVYDVELEGGGLGAGFIKRLIEGKARITPQVTI